MADFADSLPPFTITINAAAGPITVAIGQSEETDTAQPIAAFKPIFVDINQVAEVDTAFAIDPLKPIFVDINQALETDSAFAINPRQAGSILIGQASEVDTAYPITPIKPINVSIGQALETDFAFAITPVQTALIQIGQALETDVAFPITPFNVIVRPIGQAQETDTARTITPFVKQPVAIGTIPNFTFVVGVEATVDFNVYVTGNLPPFTFIETGFPSWFVLAANGIATGTPTDTEPYTACEVTVEDTDTNVAKSNLFSIQGRQVAQSRRYPMAEGAGDVITETGGQDGTWDDTLDWTAIESNTRRYPMTEEDGATVEDVLQPDGTNDGVIINYVPGMRD